MVTIVFYEKPGCINNTKQKKMLLDAGHQIECRNLLTEKWNKQILLKYFKSMPVNEWFNSSAPDVKSGLIDPCTLSEGVALKLMVQNPILIRRPLMRVNNQYKVGFDIDQVDQWIGLNIGAVKEDLESCPQQSGHRCDEPDRYAEVK